MTTKYNIGDKVWFICRNKPMIFSIKKIEVETDNIIRYIINSGKIDLSVIESVIYPTKKELLNSFLTDEDKL